MPVISPEVITGNLNWRSMNSRLCGITSEDHRLRVISTSDSYSFTTYFLYILIFCFVLETTTQFKLLLHTFSPSWINCFRTTPFTSIGYHLAFTGITQTTGICHMGQIGTQWGKWIDLYFYFLTVCIRTLVHWLKKSPGHCTTALLRK